LTASTGSLVNPFRYTARESDAETGLYYYRARYYDPATGRFLSEDPLQLNGGDADFYRYSINNPVNFKDPSGEFLPLIVLLPTVGGLIGGISDVLTAGPCENKLKAFGRGFVSGAAGTLVGIGVGALTANPFLAGAASGEISSILDQSLAGEPLDALKVANATLLGAVSGKIASDLFPTRGPLPGLGRPRPFGPNSQALSLQESGADALGGSPQYLQNLLMHPNNSKSECGCK